MIKKEFKFKKGTEDWKIWSNVNIWLCKEISKIRKTSFVPVKIKTDVKVIVEVLKGAEKHTKSKVEENEK